MSDEGDDSVQDAADAVIEELAQMFGERWGGAWLEWEATIELCIALVEPTAKDADLVSRSAYEAGWIGTTVAVRYSAKELEGFLARLRPVIESAASLLSIGPDHRLNKLTAELNAFDTDLMGRLLAELPADVLAISVHPGARYELLGKPRGR